jgi:hypothetical protein
MSKQATSVLHKKIAAAAAARARLTPPADSTADAQDALAGLLSEFFRTKIDGARFSMRRMAIEEYRAAHADWTHFRMSGSAAALVAMPAALVLAAAGAAIGGESAGGQPAAAPTALDRQLAGLLAVRLAAIGLHKILVFANAPPPLKVEATAADSESLSLDRSFARLAVASLQIPLAGAEHPCLVGAPLAEEAAPTIVAPDETWSAAMQAAAEGAGIPCRGVLARQKLKTDELLGLQKGGVIALPAATIEKLSIETPTGARLAEGRLGDFRSRRAIQIE